MASLLLVSILFYFIFLPLLRFSATYPLSRLIWLLQIDNNGGKMVPWGNSVKIPSKKERKEAQLCIVVMQFRNFTVLRNSESISLYSIFCLECKWKSFKVNCLQTYLIVLWEPEQHNVSAYFTSKVYENGVSLIILKTFTNFWMLEENKVVQRSHFKQAFSPSSMEDLWPRSGFGNFDLLLLLLTATAAWIPDKIFP